MYHRRVHHLGSTERSASNSISVNTDRIRHHHSHRIHRDRRGLCDTMDRKCEDERRQRQLSNVPIENGWDWQFFMKGQTSGSCGTLLLEAGATPLGRNPPLLSSTFWVEENSVVVQFERLTLAERNKRGALHASTITVQQGS